MEVPGPGLDQILGHFERYAAVLGHKKSSNRKFFGTIFGKEIVKHRSLGHFGRYVGQQIDQNLGLNRRVKIFDNFLSENGF